MKNLKVVFMGTPDFACEILQKLIENTNVVMVVSQPDSEVGRKRILTPSPVKELALKNGIEVFTPERIRKDYEVLKEVNPDMIVTCAYGQIIPKGVLDIPKYGCINVHASLLPKYRGGAPIHHAIMNGDSETGITIMYMDEGMDSGDIISTIATPISKEDNLDTLSERLSKMGAELLIETLPSILDGTNDRIKQDESEVTFAKIIKKDDELIDFNRSSREVFDHIRGLCSNPGAYFLLNGEVVKVYASRIGEKCTETNKITNIYKDGFGIGCLDREIIITELKPQGKKRIAAKDYLNGVNKDKLKGAIINE